MASVHEIGIAADTRGFDEGVRSGIIKPLEKAEDAFKDLEKAASDAGADGAKGVTKLDDALDDARKSTEKLDRSTKDIGDSGKREFGKAADAGREFKDETLSNLSEVTSSFDGSMESVGDLVQGTLGGLTQGLGPALGGAAAAAAAGVGVITEAFTRAGEAADDARDSAFQFAYDVQGALDKAGYTERVSQWTGDTEKLKQAQDIAKVSGQDVVDVIDALASGGDKLDGLWEAFEEGANTTDVATGRALELEGALKGTREGYLNGADAAKLAAKLNYDYATSVGEATDRTDELGNKIYTLPDGKEIVVDANTKTAYEDLDAVEKRKLQDKTVRVNADTGAVERALGDLNGRTIRVNVAATNLTMGRSIL